MAWFKKKDKIPQIPELPKLPTIPELELQEEDYTPLPETPQYFQNQDQQIKSAMTSGEEEVSGFELPSLPDFTVEEPQLPPPISRRELEEYNKNRHLRLNISPPTESSSKVARHQVYQSFEPRIKEPIFIRIDKFEEAKKKMDEIKKEMKDIENSLKRIRETKQKEDLEIIGWTHEVSQVRDNLAQIDSNIFDKL